MATILDVINTAMRSFPAMTLATAKELFDSTHREIVSKVHLQTDSNPIYLTAGTPTYTIGNTVMGVYTAKYQTAAGDEYTWLTPTRRETVDQDYPNLYKQHGTPQVYWIDGSEIGFAPVPDTSSSGGNSYPYVVLRVDMASISSANTAGVMPSDVPTLDAWTYGIRQRYAMENADPRYPMFKKGFDEAMKDLHRHRFTKDRYAGAPVVRPKPFFKNHRVK